MIFETAYDIAETAPTAKPSRLGRRWKKLRPHKLQQEFLASQLRFNISPAGRRSGKTEIAKRRLVVKALKGIPGFRYIAAAPTYNQAEQIFWSDIKNLIPRGCVRKITETKGRIQLINGAFIVVMGMEKPERVEGDPIGHIVMDEFANMKRKVWTEHVRPALSDPTSLGSADFIGVPEGRNHYYELWLDAREKGWGKFHWFSSDIIPAEEIEDAKKDLDPRTYRQEYEGSFEAYSGLCYYTWTDDNISDVEYRPDLPLVFTFDFNREPGTAAVVQEQGDKTCIIDEVYIPKDSNTPTVCRVLIDRYKKHEKRVRVFGDATGGHKGTAKISGSDWDLIRQIMKPEFADILFIVKRSNPPQLARINSMNSRICNTKDERRLFVSPKCRRTIRDFEGVIMKEGTNEIDKSEEILTHLTDGIGYYVHQKFPLIGNPENIQI